MRGREGRRKREKEEWESEESGGVRVCVREKQRSMWVYAAKRKSPAVLAIERILPPTTATTYVLVFLFHAR